MRILFVLENFLPHIGGVEVVFSQLGEQLVKKGHSVTVLTRKLSGTKSYEIIRGMHIIRINSFGSRYIFSFLAIFPALRLSKNADIVHTTTFNGAPPAWVAARIRKRPVLLTVHEVWLKFWDELTDTPWISRKFHKFLEWLIYRLPFDRYVAVSKFTGKDLIQNGIPKKKVVTVYNAIDYSLFDRKKHPRVLARKRVGFGKEFTYFAYGRPGISKGFEWLIEAAPLVRKQVSGSKLFLVLSRAPDYKKEYFRLLNRIKELNLEDYIRILEPLSREKLTDYLAAADCVVIPSLREGFGYAAAEPCALGTPVVSTNAASLPEVVSGTHVLVEPRNAKALANGIITIANGKGKKIPQKKFTLKENVNGYLSAYHYLLQRARSDRE